MSGSQKKEVPGDPGLVWILQGLGVLIELSTRLLVGLAVGVVSAVGTVLQWACGGGKTPPSAAL